MDVINKWGQRGGGGDGGGDGSFFSSISKLFSTPPTTTVTPLENNNGKLEELTKLQKDRENLIIQMQKLQNEYQENKQRDEVNSDQMRKIQEQIREIDAKMQNQGGTVPNVNNEKMMGGDLFSALASPSIAREGINTSSCYGGKRSRRKVRKSRGMKKSRKHKKTRRTRR